MVSTLSNRNPGWQGPGEPTLKYLLGTRLKNVLVLARTRRAEAKHLFLATVADLWNYHVFKRTRASCPCCGWTGKAFLATANWRAVTYQSRCPVCDSRSRHRGLVRYLNLHKDEITNRQVLVFAPERIVLQALANLIEEQGISTTDYQSSDVDFPGEDIQQLSFASQSYDLIICNHVLEHVPDDRAAVRECARVLRAEGMALFTVPGDFEKHDTWCFDFPDGNGHYRHYGMDIVQKFDSAFASTEVVDMSTLGLPREHIRRGDMLFVCRKPIV